ncbi:MAG: diguanylate cyclase [Anaerolineales bacterium]|nr:diguanylate cyclase [Anaerolineales bacterium]
MNKPSPQAHKADILVVDDTPENLRVLSHMLSHYGYKVRAVTEGALAITIAQTAPPDLIMLDVNMPGMDGYETCQQLKADERTRSIPVIFISALGEVEDKVKAFAVGGVDYVTKPFQIEEVLARLETHLSIRRLQIELEQKNQRLAAGLAELSESRAAEREQRILAETLRDTIAAINSTLNFNEVLTLILNNLARVVPHDAANIALIDEHGILHIRESRGYKERGVAELIASLSLPLNHFPTWRKIAETRAPIAISDTRLTPDWVEIPEMSWVRSTAAAPIISQGKIIGLLNLDSATPGFFKSEHAERLQTFSNYAAVAIEKARLFERTQQLAIMDELTGLYNRRQILHLAKSEYERARRYHRTLSVIMIDIDQFKHINDTYGHPVGDRILQALATCCRANLRSVDLIGRYGGEEFLVLMPETNMEKALEVAERIRRNVEAIHLPTPKGPAQITISLGVATLAVGSDVSLDQLIINADDALYMAKAAGRNRVQSYQK